MHKVLATSTPAYQKPHRTHKTPALSLCTAVVFPRTRTDIACRAFSVAAPSVGTRLLTIFVYALPPILSSVTLKKLAYITSLSLAPPSASVSLDFMVLYKYRIIIIINSKNKISGNSWWSQQSCQSKIANKDCFMLSKCTSRGVLNPRPTFLVYLGIFPAFPESNDFFLFKNTVGCFWKARSDYKNTTKH